MPFNLRGLLQDEEFLLGAGLLSAGSQGQNIGQATFPALIQAGKTASFFDTAQAKRNKNEALEKLLSSDQVSDIDKLYISAGVTPPKRTNKNIKYDTMFNAEGKKFDVDLSDPSSSSIIKQKISEGYSFSKPDKSISKTKNFKTLFRPDGKDRVEVDLNNPEHEKIIEFYLGNDYSFTQFNQPNKFGLNDEALAVYNKLNVATNDDEWNKIFDGLSKSEKHLYKNKIKNNPDIIEEAIAAKIENVKTLDPLQISAAAEYKLPDKVKDYENAVDIIEAQWSANPNATFEQVIESLVAAGLLIK